MDTVAATYRGKTSKKPGAAAAEAEKKKTKKYEFLEGQYFFIPLAIETFGPWGEDCKAFVKKLGKFITEVTFERRSCEFLRQRLSVEIQRGNAASVLGTVPSGPTLYEIFSLL